jgi:hypothetical protein
MRLWIKFAIMYTFFTLLFFRMMNAQCLIVKDSVVLCGDNRYEISVIRLHKKLTVHYSCHCKRTCPFTNVTQWSVSLRMTWGIDRRFVKHSSLSIIFILCWRFSKFLLKYTREITLVGKANIKCNF